MLSTENYTLNMQHLLNSQISGTVRTTKNGDMQTTCQNSLLRKLSSKESLPSAEAAGVAVTSPANSDLRGIHSNDSDIFDLNLQNVRQE